MTAPQTSVIIPTCNRPRELARCLRALYPQLPADGSVDVLILDDGTSSATRELVETEFPWACWREGPRRGPAANRNRGAQLARGEWIIFLDDDCIPRANFVAAYMAAIRDGTAKASLEGPTFVPGDKRSLLWEAPHNPHGGLLISCNFAISRRFFADLGGFDERYPAAAFEDTEFAERLYRQGGTVCFVREAGVDHPWRPLPPAATLALRWEARVIYALDQGARPATILWRLPWHVLRVVQARFRRQPLTPANLKASLIFMHEWLLVSYQTPGWIRKWNERPRSAFWQSEILRSGPVPNYGF